MPHASSATCPPQPSVWVEETTAPEVHPREGEETCPKKKPKLGVHKISKRTASREAAARQAIGIGEGSRGDGSGAPTLREGLSTGQEDAEIVLVGIEAQDPDDGAPISAVCGLQELLGDGLSWSYASSCVTREWVGEELFGEHRGVEAVDGKERGNDDKSRGAQPPTSKASVRMEVDSECHDATEAGLPIAKKGM
ncbi:hypothetical protein GW17_00008888 [Ensete ventricosum]|nr:hypothetical protein GW17_00008888 [Ensete ventricosum]